MKRRQSLDGIRAVALLIVVFFHSTYLSKWQLTGGFLSVDVFFVLSGSLITSLLVTEWRRTDSIRLAGFYLRRATRLGPALVILLISVVLVTHFAGPAGTQPLWQSMLATALYVANWVQVAHPAASTYLDHTWSLSIEEQFYLIAPVVLLFLLRRGHAPRRVAGFALLGALASAALRWTWLVRWTPHGIYGYKVLYENTFTRADSLLIGVAVGCLSVDPRVRAALAELGATLAHHRVIRVMAVELPPWLATVYIAVFMQRSNIDSLWLYRYGFTLVEALAAVIVMHCLIVERSLFVRVFSTRPLVDIGRVSYSVYLYHVPITLVVLEHTSLGPLMRLLVITSTSIAAATASWWLVERRAIAYGHRRSAAMKRPRVAPPVLLDVPLGAAVSSDLAA